MNRTAIEFDTGALREFCRKWKISELFVFGSVLRDDFGPDSDIDFVADFENDAEWDLLDHMDMEDELARIVARPVDLLTKYSVELSENLIYKARILSQLEPVVERR